MFFTAPPPALLYVDSRQAIAARKDSIRQQEKRAQVIEDLRLRVNALDKVFSWNSEYQRASHKVTTHTRTRERKDTGRYSRAERGDQFPVSMLHAQNLTLPRMTRALFRFTACLVP